MLDAVLLVLLILWSMFVGVCIGGKMATATSRSQGDDYTEKPPKKDEVDGSPTVEIRSRFPLDIALRKAGFAIRSRPAKGQPVWVRNGLEYLESEAVRRMRGMEAVNGL